MDRMIRATAANDQIRAFAVTTRETVEEARTRHQTSPVITAALGRLLTAAAMMGWTMKSDSDRLTIRIEGSGPVGLINVEADANGHVWGFPRNPQVDLPLTAAGKLDVSGALGLGVLSVIKDLGLKEPYIGQTHLVSGEIAEDLAYYFTASEQVPSAVALGVLVDRDYSVKAAGGFILQMMPGASDEAAEQLQQKVTAFPPVTTYLSEGHTPEEMLQTLLGDMDLEIMEEKDVCFQCDCNREKVKSALMSIGAKELRDIALDSEETVTLHCNACNEPYEFSKEELLDLADQAELSSDIEE